MFIYKLEVSFSECLIIMSYYIITMSNHNVSLYNHNVSLYFPHTLTTILLLYREDVIQQLNEQINIYEQDVEMLKEQV